VWNGEAQGREDHCPAPDPQWQEAHLHSLDHLEIVVNNLAKVVKVAVLLLAVQAGDLDLDVGHLVHGLLQGLNLFGVGECAKALGKQRCVAAHILATLNQAKQGKGGG
jgi:hypothetical protein